jgi:hypothetical protein
MATTTPTPTHKGEGKDRLYLFDTTLRCPSARSREASEDGQIREIVARYGDTA